jgi:hypothetical protein
MKQEEKFKIGTEPASQGSLKKSRTKSQPAKVLSKNQEPNNTGIQPYL